MSKAGGPEIPTLDAWAKQHLNALITAKSQQSYDKAFDDFISKNVRVTLNGKSMTREEYKRHIRSEESFRNPTSLEIQNTVEAGKFDTPDLQDNAVVGMFYTASYTIPLQYEGGFVEHTYQSSMNSHVVTDDLLPLPPQPPTGFDKRRVVAVDQVLKEKPLPIGLPPRA